MTWEPCTLPAGTKLVNGNGIGLPDWFARAESYRLTSVRRDEDGRTFVCIRNTAPPKRMAHSGMFGGPQAADCCAWGLNGGQCQWYEVRP